jgi:hypothetical protein
MSRFKGKTCYYCGDAAVSIEDVPPKQLFKGLHCNKIRVPSCEKHNSSKSFDDQVIVDLFRKVVNPQGKEAFIDPDVAQILAQGASSFVKTKNRISLARLVEHPKLPDVPYLEPGVAIFAWMCQAVAGLIYSGCGYRDEGIDWTKAVVFSPLYLQLPKYPPLSLEEGAQLLQDRAAIADAADHAGQWYQGWSATPVPYPSSIFTFYVRLDNEGYVGFRLLFFSKNRWYVIVKVSRRTRQALEIKLKAQGTG